jgi:hypothetical protein
MARNEIISGKDPPAAIKYLVVEVAASWTLYSLGQASCEKQADPKEK